MKYTVNDIFCGAGGIGCGFLQAGFDIAGAWDYDKYAVEAYRHNLGDHVKQADITEMTWRDLPKANVWTFGAPCVAFSLSGKKMGMTFKCKGCGHEETFTSEPIMTGATFCTECGVLSKPKDDRGLLFFQVMRIIQETQENNPDNLPDILMLENVPGIRKHLDVIEEAYEMLGYRMYYTAYNSRHWGVPQNRERYFVLGVHHTVTGDFVFPTPPEDDTPLLASVMETDVDDKLYVDYTKLHEGFIEPVEGGIKVRQATKQGYDIAVNGDSINLAHPKSKTRRGRVGKQIAQTLLTGREQVYVEDVDTMRIRYYTAREFARLQAFPDSFELVVPESESIKQFGNAVTVNISRAIATEISKFLDSSK